MATATLTATNGPREIIPRQEGRLTRLFINNNDAVTQGEQIGWIQSTADHSTVSKLASLLDSALHLMNENKT